MKNFLITSFWLLVTLGLLFGADDLRAQSGAYTRDAVFSPHYPGEILRFTCALDSVDQDTSRNFSLGKYDGARWTTAPIWLQRKISSAAGKPYVTVFLDGSFDASNWFACDTLMTADSLETAGLIQINLTNYKFPWYRIRSNGIQYGGGVNRSDTILDMIWYLYQKD